MWHSVQGEVEDITTETVTGCPKVYDVTEEQLQGLMRSNPASVSTEHDFFFFFFFFSLWAKEIVSSVCVLKWVRAYFE